MCYYKSIYNYDYNHLNEKKIHLYATVSVQIKYWYRINVKKVSVCLSSCNCDVMFVVFSSLLQISSAACGYGFTLLASNTKDVTKVWGMGLNKDSQLGFQRSQHDRRKSPVITPQLSSFSSSPVC